MAQGSHTSLTISEETPSAEQQLMNTAGEQLLATPNTTNLAAYRVAFDKASPGENSKMPQILKKAGSLP